YPEKILPDVDLHGETAAPYLARFYDELRGHGVDVVDLAPLFIQNHASERGPVFCKTDTHWSGFGCVLAAQTIKEKIEGKLAGQPRKNYAAEWKDITIKGDLGDLAGPNTKKPEAERISVRTISDKETGAGVTPDPGSPLLIIGDSHTLVFHDFLAEKSGLLDQLAYETGFAPDLIGTRGSGATSVRVTLYRRARKEPDYLAKKKIVVWCFAARECSESDQGWGKVPRGQSVSEASNAQQSRPNIERAASLNVEGWMLNISLFSKRLAVAAIASTIAISLLAQNTPARADQPRDLTVLILGDSLGLCGFSK